MKTWRDLVHDQAELAAWFLRKVAPGYFWPAAMPEIAVRFDDFHGARLAGYCEPGARGGYRIHVGAHLSLADAFYVLLHELCHILRGDVQPGTGETSAIADDPAWVALVPRMVALMSSERAAERAASERACDDFAFEEYRCWEAANL